MQLPNRLNLHSDDSHLDAFQLDDIYLYKYSIYCFVQIFK